ncbi:hypothetical protein WJX72_008493 [[Myrmecia] bisecta]|uniref:Uncharacterized protein n=1 Tax=[Myrmecia] bisecta TaxID=41462 RepID=A0AAW1Q4F5_9CHLO
MDCWGCFLCSVVLTEARAPKALCAAGTCELQVQASKWRSLKNRQKALMGDACPGILHLKQASSFRKPLLSDRPFGVVAPEDLMKRLAERYRLDPRLVRGILAAMASRPGADHASPGHRPMACKDACGSLPGEVRRPKLAGHRAHIRRQLWSELRKLGPILKYMSNAPRQDYLIQLI